MASLGWPSQEHHTLISSSRTHQICPRLVFWTFQKEISKNKSGLPFRHCTVVNNSATVNTPKINGTEDGQVIVPTYNWKDDLSIRFKTVKNIKTYHHFCFTSEKPGSVFVKVHADRRNRNSTFTLPVMVSLFLSTTSPCWTSWTPPRKAMVPVPAHQRVLPRLCKRHCCSPTHST